MSFIWKEQQAEAQKGEHPKKRAAAFSLIGKVVGVMAVLKVLPYIFDVFQPFFVSEPKITSPTYSLPSTLVGLTPAPAAPSV